MARRFPLLQAASFVFLVSPVIKESTSRAHVVHPRTHTVKAAMAVVPMDVKRAITEVEQLAQEKQSKTLRLAKFAPPEMKHTFPRIPQTFALARLKPTEN